MSESAVLARQDHRARERSELERRRVMVARLRWIESNLTVVQIAAALQQANPPIVVSLRTIERDLVAIRDDSRRYLTATNFDARLEISTALMRYEMLARKATQYALTENGKDASKWARAAIRATEAKTTLLQHVGMIDRHVGTLFVDDGKDAKALPSGTELAKRFEGVRVLDAEIVSEAETAWMYGDAAGSDGRRG